MFMVQSGGNVRSGDKLRYNFCGKENFFLS